ncbi:MAG: Zn-dependent hydrolase [Rhodospirillales bacterium]|nr:Zn-dependent hydrolase [Rhodospirillales bacterium]
MNDRDLARAVDASIPTAEALFQDLREQTKDVLGVTRASYGEGEQKAHALMAEAARRLDLGVTRDAAGNLYMTLKGRRTDGHGIIIGSHLDSVPQGGNYDGAAGVVAGLAAIAALQRAKITPASDITVMGTRGEESAWFPTLHIGSRAALGLLPAKELDTIRRADSGRTLADHMAEAGCDVEALRAGRHVLDAGKVKAYFELHIEQGPVLEHEGFPIGVVTGIRGNVRALEAVCRGDYGHGGAVPRKLRHDAVLAMAEYAHRLEGEWEDIEAAGGDMVFTIGKFYTDAKAHAHSKISGEVRFTVDSRSHTKAILDRMERVYRERAQEIGEKRGVRFDLGRITRVKPAVMDSGLRARLWDAVKTYAIPAIDIPSGAGHDAGDFANAGVPTAMIFIRNPHGSHNPDEDMAIDDFAKGVQVLARTLATME